MAAMNPVLQGRAPSRNIHLSPSVATPRPALTAQAGTYPLCYNSPALDASEHDMATQTLGYEQVNERLGDLTAAVKELRGELHREIRMLYFFIGGSWVTLMGTMLGLYLTR